MEPATRTRLKRLDTGSQPFRIPSMYVLASGDCAENDPLSCFRGSHTTIREGFQTRY